jgi:hypothetical protein
MAKGKATGIGRSQPKGRTLGKANFKESADDDGLQMFTDSRNDSGDDDDEDDGNVFDLDGGDSEDNEDDDDDDDEVNKSAPQCTLIREMVYEE